MTTERDDLMGDIAEHLRPYARFRAELLATTNIEARTGRFREDAIDGEYYEHMDYVSYMVDNAVAAITEAAEYADAWAHDEPFPDCKHEHYDPNGRRMYGNCQDDEWGMTYGGNND